MKTVNLAKKIEERVNLLQEILPDPRNTTVMIHDIPYLQTLEGTDWEVSGVQSGGRLYMTAKKNNITLFSKENFILEIESSGKSKEAKDYHPDEPINLDDIPF